MYNYLVYQDAQELDKLVLPAVLYNAVINKRKNVILKYLEKHPKLALKIFNFNQTLKIASSYKAEDKCGCFTTIPWFTQYQKEQNKPRMIISFTQQNELYRYMIQYWYPYPNISNMRYLSNLAMGLLQNVKLAWSYIGNNLQPCYNQNLWKSEKIENVYQFLTIARKFT